MKRQIIKIDEDLCNGCGDCVPNCHEGALQIIDGKVRLVSELMCDGLGACIGHCPLGAITIEEREAQPYDELLVIKEMLPKGKNTVFAHLKHLKEHGETGYLQIAVEYLKTNANKIDFDVKDLIFSVHHNKPEITKPSSSGHNHAGGGGCPGSRTLSFDDAKPVSQNMDDVPSALRQWPIQLHLVNPMANYFQSADLLVAADCVAFSIGNFHQKYLAGKSLVIACPKLDSNMDTYIEKFVRLISDAKVNTITVMLMEVPCCGGLLQMVKQASDKASRKVPIKLMVVGLQGEIKYEEWV